MRTRFTLPANRLRAEKARNISEALLESKIDNLMADMTLEDKIGQMTQADRMTCTPQHVFEYGLGAIFSSAGSTPIPNQPSTWVEMHDEYWRASMARAEGALAIPVLYGIDSIHGNNNVRGATIFPHNIGLGACDDFELIAQVARATAVETLTAGIDWVFAPNLAVAQDLRWGRSYESFHCDPAKVKQFAHEMTLGLQYDLGEEAVLACLKHWVGDGGTTFGIDQGDTRIDYEDLFHTHIAPFIEGIEAGAMTVMASFCSWNGEKCHASRYLLHDVLKGELGFSGFILSDMQGIDYLADDFYLAVEKGVNAGIDMFMVPQNWREFIECLTRHVKLGTVSMARIDDAVRRILRVKYKFNLFDKPPPAMRQLSNSAEFGSVHHRQIARQAVQSSLVMLKNNAQALPLDASSKLLVLGRHADDKGLQCGGFTVEWQGVMGNGPIPSGSSIWQGVKQCWPDANYLSSSETDGLSRAQLEARLKLAVKGIDAVVYVYGEMPYAEGVGDIHSVPDVSAGAGIDIDGAMNLQQVKRHSAVFCEQHPEHLAVLTILARLDVSVISVFISGRPLVCDQEIDASDAFVCAWLPGSEGAGVADVLAGHADVKGKLPFPWPQRQQEDELSAIWRHPVGFGLTYDN